MSYADYISAYLSQYPDVDHGTIDRFVLDSWVGEMYRTHQGVY